VEFKENKNVKDLSKKLHWLNVYWSDRDLKSRGVRTVTPAMGAATTGPMYSIRENEFNMATMGYICASLFSRTLVLESSPNGTAINY